MTNAEKYADKIIYLVAMHDNIHRRPFLVKLCKEIELKARLEERMDVMNNWKPYARYMGMIHLEKWVHERADNQVERAKKLREELEKLTR